MRYLRQFTMLVLGFIAIAATITGGLLMYDTSGSMVGRFSGNLTGSPFKSYFIPGLLLLVLLGIGSFIVLQIILKHKDNYPAYITYFALLVIAFETVQVWLLDTFISLDGAFILLAVFLLLLAFLMNNQMKAIKRRGDQNDGQALPKRASHHKHRHKKR